MTDKTATMTVYSVKTGVGQLVGDADGDILIASGKFTKSRPAKKKTVKPKVEVDRTNSCDQRRKN